MADDQKDLSALALRSFTLAAAVGMILLLSAPASAQPCSDPEFCPPDQPPGCWDDDVGVDTCSDGVPDSCEPGPTPTFTFIDNEDGLDNGQIFALNNADSTNCGTLQVPETGYYDIFDAELSESCDDQQDETGYLTITNSCNGNGYSTIRNAGKRYLVVDTDNSPDCSTGGVADDNLCAADEKCRFNTGHGFCCVPKEPVYMGTYLLVAGEDNRICIHHWCPEWLADADGEKLLGFVGNLLCGDPGSVNSIHFRIDASALACLDSETLQECSFGCFSGTCAEDPCLDAGCANFCKDGVCLTENPCTDAGCEHGCVNGYCLQAPETDGEDADGDGYAQVADCDDSNADVNPGRSEVCDNGIDDNCDGNIDEAQCSTDPLDPDAGTGGGGAGDTSNSGCGCQTNSSGGLGLLMLFGLALYFRRRR